MQIRVIGIHKDYFMDICFPTIFPMFSTNSFKSSECISTRFCQCSEYFYFLLGGIAVRIFIYGQIAFVLCSMNVHTFYAIQQHMCKYTGLRMNCVENNRYKKIIYIFYFRYCNDSKLNLFVSQTLFESSFEYKWSQQKRVRTL